MIGFFGVASVSELEMRQKKGLISKDTLILAVEDPKANVGSGGATLNALLIVAEHLGGRQGYTVSSLLWFKTY